MPEPDATRRGRSRMSRDALAPVFIGTAGFSYPDWRGPVYPAGSSKAEHPLARLSRYVDLLEVNVSHYRIPSPETARGWLGLTESRPGFRFTAKLHRSFTHGPERATREDHRAMVAFLAALNADGRLLAALAQFPPSLRACERAEAYVHRLAWHFEGTALAVEFRDASWDRDEVRAALCERGIAWVVADLPQGRGSIPPTDAVTAPLAYARLHGRSAAWFTRGAGRDAKYDWLYSDEEMKPWIERIARFRREAERVVAVANNHYGGKAVVNALQLKSAAEGGRVPVPSSLLQAFPVLASIAAPGAHGEADAPLG